MAEEIKEKVKEVFLKTFQSLDQDSFDFSKPRTDFENWDSLTHMQLLSEAESVFKISFEMDEIVEINSAQDLANLIDKKLSAK